MVLVGGEMGGDEGEEACALVGGQLGGDFVQVGERGVGADFFESREFCFCGGDGGLSGGGR